MRRSNKNSGESELSPKRPAISPEIRENQMISLAMDRAEQRLRDGTASSQEIVHFLKLGSSKERLEKEIMEKQAELITAKTENLNSSKEIRKLYDDAIQAMKRYNGDFVDDQDLPGTINFSDF